jgi:hypothetical protein
MSTPTLHDRFVHITVAQRAQLLTLIGNTPQSPDLATLVQDLAEEKFTDTNHDTYYRRTAANQYASDGEIEIDADAVVSIGSDGVYVHAWVFVEAIDDTAQWMTVCTTCDLPLIVPEVTLEATVVLNTPLNEDGVEVNHPTAQQNGSTGDEIIHCGRCGKNYGLDELELEPVAAESPAEPVYRVYWHEPDGLQERICVGADEVIATLGGDLDDHPQWRNRIARHLGNVGHSLNLWAGDKNDQCLYVIVRA